MKFRCERDTLSEVLGSAGRAASTGRGTLSVLGCLKLALEGQKLTVTGTDLDLTIVANVTVAGEEDGEAADPSQVGVRPGPFARFGCNRHRHRWRRGGDLSGSLPLLGSTESSRGVPSSVSPQPSPSRSMPRHLPKDSSRW